MKFPIKLPKYGEKEEMKIRRPKNMVNQMIILKMKTILNTVKGKHQVSLMNLLKKSKTRTKIKNIIRKEIMHIIVNQMTVQQTAKVEDRRRKHEKIKEKYKMTTMIQKMKVVPKRKKNLQKRKGRLLLLETINIHTSRNVTF